MAHALTFAALSQGLRRAYRASVVRLSVLQAAITALAGALGFRLDPDSSSYAGGELVPGALALWPIGCAGGMAAVVIVSAIAAGLCVELLPDTRARALFMGGGFVWLLFPGADALGVLGVALLARAARARARLALWTLVGLLHL